MNTNKLKDFVISVIVPIYNSEHTLSNSIDSLIKQTIFGKLEIVCVDDGSEDDSLSIVKKYSDNYENIKVYHQENFGVSAARNLGLKYSTGDYIAFFDADDIAMPGLYERLIHLVVENDADIGIIDFSKVFEDGKEIKQRNAAMKIWQDNNRMLIDFFHSNDIGINVFDKLFRRELVNGIIFPEGYAIGEDMYFLYSVIRNAKKIVLDSAEVLYKYIIHRDSAMKKEFSGKYLDTVTLSKIIIETEKCNDTVFPYAKANYIHEICKTMRIMQDTHARYFYSDTFKEYKKEIQGYKLTEAMKYMSKMHFIAYVLMRISPRLYNWIYYRMRLG